MGTRKFTLSAIKSQIVFHTRKFILSSVLVLCSLIVAAYPITRVSSAYADSPYPTVTEYPTAISNSSSNGLTADANGNVWFSGTGPGDDGSFIGKMNASGVVTAQYPMGTGATLGQPVIGPDGNLWFANGTNIESMSPNTGAVNATYALPSGVNGVTSLTVGPDGNLWFATDYSDNTYAIDSITTSGSVTSYSLSAASPSTPVVGHDGNLWFSVANSDGSSSIDSITTSGSVTSYSLSSGVEPTSNMVLGSDDNIWFTSYDSDGDYALNSITTSGSVTSYSLSSGVEPTTLIAGTGDNLWMTASSSGGSYVLDSVSTSGTITTTTSFDPGTVPTYLIDGPGGNLWFTDEDGEIGTVSSSGTTVTEYPTAISNSSSNGLTADANGNVWFSGTGPGDDGSFIGKMNASGVVTAQYPMGTGATLGQPVIGPDGNLWFANGTNIESMSPNTGAVNATYALPSGVNGVTSLTVGPDGNLWFATDYSDNTYAIDSITTSGSVTSYSLSAASPSTPVVGHDGNLWFSVANSDGSSSIDSITTSGSVTSYSLSSGVEPTSNMVLGSDDNIWFTSYDSDGDYALNSITTSGSVTSYSLSSGVEPTTLIAGTGDNLWMTASSSGGSYVLDSVSTSGTITTTTSFDPGTVPTYLIDGPGGNLWFTDEDGEIGTVSSSGTTVTEYPTAISNSSSNGLTADANGNVWFSGTGPGDDGSFIGKMNASGVVTAQYPMGTGATLGQPVIGPDGNLWFANGTNIESMSPNTGAVNATYALPSGVNGVTSLTVGPDGNLWFATDYSDNTYAIDSITTSGSVTSYSLSAASPSTPVVGHDGNLWFSVANSDGSSSIDSITTSGSVTSYSLSSGVEPTSNMVLGSDDNIWFTSYDSDGDYALNSITTSGSVTSYSLSSGVEPTTLIAGTGDNLWMTASSSGGSYVLDSVSTSGTITTTTSFDPGTVPTYLIDGPGGNLWFTDEDGEIGTVSSSGVTSHVAYFTENNGTSFTRQSMTLSSGLARQTVNSDGTVTLSVNDSPGYADSGFVIYDGTLGSLQDFTVNGTSDFQVNFWFDSSNGGQFFNWNSDGTLTGLDGDTYGISRGSSDGTMSVSGSTQVYMTSNGNASPVDLMNGAVSLSDLTNGDISGINADTYVAVWIGVTASNGSVSSTIDSIEGL